MKNLPEQIRQKSFERRLLGGLKKAEVKAYLNQLSSEWDTLQSNNSKLSDELKLRHVELKRMKDMEASLLHALKHADEHKEETLRQAQKEAELTLKEAELTKNLLIQEGEYKAKEMLDNANQKHAELVNYQNKEIKTLNDDFNVIDKHTDAMIYELNKIMHETSETINRLTKIKKAAKFHISERKIDESTKAFISGDIYKPKSVVTGNKAVSPSVTISKKRVEPKQETVDKRASELKERNTLLDKLQGLNKEKQSVKKVPMTLHDKILQG